MQTLAGITQVFAFRPIKIIVVLQCPVLTNSPPLFWHPKFYFVHQCQDSLLVSYLPPQHKYQPTMLTVSAEEQLTKRLKFVIRPMFVYRFS